MIVKYNSLNRVESPILTLCNPGCTYNNGYLSNAVGVLNNTEAEEFIYNFNAMSELNFRINYIEPEELNEKVYSKRIYDGIKNNRLIFVDEIGFFIISNVDEKIENGYRYKDVSAQSVELEIEQKQIPYIEDGTYRFMTDGNETTIGIFNTIVDVIPGWTIEHVDESIKPKYRTFSDVDVTLNCLSFLIQNLQEAYECIILFDILNRKINVYDENNYVRRTYIHLTKDDLIKSLVIKEGSENIYTAISAYGDNNLSISAINPIGSSVIYNFSQYYDWMSEGLKAKVINWSTYINNIKETYYQLNLDYFTKFDEVNNLRYEFDRLQKQKELYERCKNNIVANSDTGFVSEYNSAISEAGGSSIVIYDQISSTIAAIQQQINGCISEMSEVQNDIDEAADELEDIRDDIEDINAHCSITAYFTEQEYEELSNYILQGSYNDEYVTVTDDMTYEEKFEQMKTLYDRAESSLQKVSQPTQEFDIDSESAIFEKSFSTWNDQLETGCLINVELGADDVAWLFLLSISINYDDKNLKLTFGNRYNRNDTKSLFDKVLGGISKSANTLSYIKDKIYPLKDGTFDDMKESIQSSRNITMSGALVSENEEVLIDGSGYTGRKKLQNGTFDPKQIKITGRNIVFTDDSWDTCKTAIGEIILPNDTTTYGINAETVIGELLVGERIVLQNPDQNCRFDEDGITVFNDTNTFILNPSGDTLVSIKKGNHEIFGLDSNGALHVEADGTGIDLTSNDTIIGINSNIQATAQGIKATVSSALSKYDTSGVNINLYGYGSPSSNYSASSYNGQYYLNQMNGYVYQSDGDRWNYIQRLTLITDNLQSEITQTEKEIKSTVGQAVSKYDTTNKTVNLYGYGTPANTYDASDYNNQYYLDQTTGYLYKSNGSGWVYQEALTLITTNLQSQITQNATSISSKVDSGDFGTLIQQNANNVKIAWNNISKYIQFENGQLRIYSQNTAQNSDLLMALTSIGCRYYDSGVPIGKIGTNHISGQNTRGLVFDLEHDTSYMSWAWMTNSNDLNYTIKWAYVSGNNDISGMAANSLNAFCDVDIHSYKIKNTTLDNWNFAGGSITGTFSGYYISQLNPDNTVAAYKSFSLQFNRGVLVSASW